MTEYVDFLSKDEVLKIDDALARFIFGCNLPFRIVESKLFKEFIQTIRPSYANMIPSRTKLSSTLLNKTYNDCINEVQGLLGDESVVICDGWKNSSNNTKTVVTMLHTTDGAKAFLNAWDCTVESETGEKIAEIIAESKEIAKDKYNVEVYAVVTDNASAMVKMGNLLRHAVWSSTCNSHTGNLLAKDVVDKELCKRILVVMKELKTA